MINNTIYKNRVAEKNKKEQNQKIQIKTKILRLVTPTSSLLKTGMPTVFQDSETSRTAPMWERSDEIRTKQNVKGGAPRSLANIGLGSYETGGKYR